MRIQSGTQRTITVPETRRQWPSSTWCGGPIPGSGPAVLSHVTLNEEAVLATGYPWWPTTSQVPRGRRARGPGDARPGG